MKADVNIKLLALFNFLTDFDLFAPVAIIYFQSVTGSFTAAMGIFSTVMIAAALFEVPTGVVSDMVGRKKTIILGSLASLAAAIILAASQTYSGLLLSAVMAGMARAFYSGNNDAFLYDVLKATHSEHKYEAYLGKVSAFFQIALAISAILGSVLASVSFILVLWLSVIPRVLQAVVSLLFTEPPRLTAAPSNIFTHTREALTLFIKNARLRQLSLASIIDFAVGEASFTFRNAFIVTVWPLWAVGIARMLSNIGATVGLYFSGWVIKRFNYRKILVWGLIYNRIVNLVALLFPTPVSPLLMSTTSLYYGVHEVASDGLMQREFSHHQRATMSSLNSLMGSLAFGIFSLILGQIADYTSQRSALIVSQVLMISVIIIYARLFRKQPSK